MIVTNRDGHDAGRPESSARIGESGVPERSYDRLSRLCAKVLNAPIALVALPGDGPDGPFFRGNFGLREFQNDRPALALAQSLCQRVIDGAQLLAVGDLGDLPDEAGESTGEPPVRAFLGIPLGVPAGCVFGALCAMDASPRLWTAEEIGDLRELGETVAIEVVLRRSWEERARSEAAASGRGEQLLSTLSSIGDAVVATDDAGRITFMNPVAESLTGWPESEARGRPIGEVFRIVNEATRLPVAQPIEEAIGSARTVGLVSPAVLQARDGSERFIDDSASPILDRRGEVVGGILIFRDITERRLKEAGKARVAERAALGAAIGVAFSRGHTLTEMLRASTDAIVETLDAALARIWTVDPAGATLELQASSGITTHLDGPLGRIPVGGLMIGRIAESREPHLTNDLRDDPEIGDRDWAGHESLVGFAGYPLLARDRLVGVMALFSRRPLAEDTLQALAAVADVISLGIERKRAEEALRASEEFNRRVIDRSPDCLKIIDLDGRLVSINEVGCGLMEIDDVSGYLDRDWLEVWPPENRDRARRALEEARSGVISTFQGPCVTAKGTRRWWDVAIAPILDSEGKPDRFLSVARDITGLKAAEEVLRGQSAALKDVDRRKDEFMAILGHELRSPLAAILSAVHLARQAGMDQEELAWSHGVIERQSTQLVRLIDDLLDVSRIAQGKIQLRRQYTELADVVERATAAVHTAFERKHHDLVVSLGEGALPLDADPSRVEQILVNLLNNAAKYTDEGGRITLTAGRSGGDVVIRVMDTGMGISKEMLPHVFDLFSQVPGVLDRSQGGLGIGLTLVKKLAEMHGGGVDVSSEGPGRGSTFSVRLPLWEELPMMKSETEKSSPGRTPGRRVLVVDDNIDSATSMAMLLKVSGHEVRVAHDGDDAIDVAFDQRPDAVLLDIGLPGRDGYAVAEILRGDERCRDAFIIALSGYGQAEDRRRSREAGFDAHLVKPVDVDELLKMLADPRPARAGTESD